MMGEAFKAMEDPHFLNRALVLARRAAVRGEVPVGAVVVLDGRIVGRGFNRPISALDPTAHAEMTALRRAARRTGTYRLEGATLYVTLEPCLMCMGALIHARIKRLVYGASDSKLGSVKLAQRLLARHNVNHSFEITSGVRRQACQALLLNFFKKRRRAT
ncbi:MAG: tRNA adenosine(34) deaminase TadA [Acidobacteriota bacterium]